ncbi:hypothetical protein U2F26_25530 [Micromonospora sp. 4G57]|uniref:Uncharacterized protein n=1 Tax=Micromonospora sicca TaxID=2202420 RepID=A0ABU5JK88_9ACTN|nr:MULTISPECIES: hypothetical protein [unclassified Micromonospora]MDZ5446054.1 hypothetical protein [Micromonospora sp. 4G57]MDZ5492813.1 hypothetical protein [Micromonospora sp. 4G53]
MISYGVNVARPCGDCASEMTCELAQRIVRDRLHWTAECHCPHCGSTVETFGWDDTPAEIRDALVARSGLARLTIEGKTGPGRAALLKVFRDAGASLSEAKAAAQRAVTTGIEGTRVELELLKQRLERKNVIAIVNGGDSC